MPILLDLFLTFLKIGAVTFGGGYAMIPIIKDEVLAHGWLLEEELINFIAIAESTPGPIAINMATFIGSSQGGILGAILATLGVVLPSFLIVLLIVALINGLLKFAGVQAFLSGIRPVVIGLIISTGITLTLSVIFSVTSIGNGFSFDWRALTIFGINFIIWLTYKKITKKAISPIILIIVSAALGMLLYGALGFL
jgi:chromate transporter